MVSSLSARAVQARGGGRCTLRGLEVRGVGSTGLLWAVPGYVPLLFAEEAPSFCHESILFCFAEGVPGTDGIYVHRIWVAGGGASSLSALSKATLPLVSCTQVPLIPHLWAKREDGLFGKILAHLISRGLLPLFHSFWPGIPVHDGV
jgi:hypothetical protein